MSAVKERTRLTNLITVGTEQEAALIVAALEEHCIHAVYSSDTPSSWGIVVPGAIPVSVHAEDVPKAESLLKELQFVNRRTVGAKVAQAHISTWLYLCKMLAVAILAVLALAYVWNILG
jgi:hypothetical protein